MIFMSQQIILDIYSAMLASRESDLIEAELVNSGEANFLASSRGHEGSAVLAPILHKGDWLHCHYRDKALMLARGISNEMFFLSALTKSSSHSAGRQMVSHMSAPEFNILSLVGPVGNNALQATGIAMAIKDNADNPVVFCSMGDGTSQQGEVLEAIAEAKRNNLPVLFFIHNNQLAISTRTQGQTFFSLPNGINPSSFYDIPITYIDGTKPLEQYEQLNNIVDNMRIDRQPQIIIFNVERLDNHSNADDQNLYRSHAELQRILEHDPIQNSYNYLLKLGYLATELEQLELKIKQEVRNAVNLARQDSEPLATNSAELELPVQLKSLANEYRGDFNQSERLTMLEAMRAVFDYNLANNCDLIIIGEDVEDGKGDVFGITRGLSTKYPDRVKNSALSESTIAGLSAGLALAGKTPVAFIQFADFLPLAYNQIFTEISTMYWRTNGGWQTPVIIFAACGAYRPGLGPFNSQTNEATFAHIPGLDVYMPSNAADAAGMLNAALQSKRPSLFLYPKKLLNNSSNIDTTSLDVSQQLVPVGKARIVNSGTDITFVGWGNTISLCLQVSETLETVGISSEVIDLRTLKPYDLTTILNSANKTGKLIVVHEDNLTCGLGGDILASVAEKATSNIKMRRIARADTYTPCNFANQLEVLPSYEKILSCASELLDLELSWEQVVQQDKSLFTVEVIGASPSDESVLINSIQVKIGDQVKAGDVLVEIEASKSAGEILAPCDGIVNEIHVELEEKALVGNSLITLRLPQGMTKKNNAIKPAKAILTRKLKVINNDSFSDNKSVINRVGIYKPQFTTGSREVLNSELLQRFPEFNEDDILQRTGISQRNWLAEDESIVDLAVKSSCDVLYKNNLSLQNIDLLICATCSPEQYQSPSLSCLVLNQLNKIFGESTIPAYDLNAACSGYIYALQVAQDYLVTRPNARVLLVTAEALSPRIKPDDFETAFLFADGASATILAGANHLNSCIAELKQIYLCSAAENGDILNIPTKFEDGINMQGKKLFTSAVKTMALAIHKCSQDAGVAVSDIDLVVPHQANQRILTAVESRLKLPHGIMFSNIAKHGNTSSCTIPIALNEVLDLQTSQQTVALCAFGAGFTAGAALLTIL
ncbi:MAG: hypothetical protein RLZZ293_860 [Pseudomonadota bacterium]